MSEIKILIGGEDFSEIRRDNYYYVDKTGFLNDFLPRSAIVSLITRPRRFGKTLFMSMLSEFFDIRKKENCNLFTGLKISANKELCKEWMNQYPVIFFSLKDTEGNSFSDSLTEMQRTFSSVVIENSILLTSNAVDTTDKEVLSRIKENRATESELRSFLMILARAMHYHYHKPAIVLIDEYDASVAKAEENGYYDAMIKFMRIFLSSALKTPRNLKFAILTGCLRITKESIFTGLNNLKCFGISDPKFADAIGFTQVEVDKLLADAGLTSRKEAIKIWYDGYLFGTKQEIYCPWSIMNYIDDVQDNPETAPAAYWLNTSGNELVQRLIAHSPTDLTDTIDFLLAGNVLPVRINYAINYKNLTSTPENIWSLLYFAGYLTKAPKEVADKLQLPGSGKNILTIPNKEVAQIFEEELKQWFSHRLTSSKRTELYQAFWKPDAELFVKLLSQTLLVSISMFDYREHFYHGLLTGIFFSTKAQTVSNLETGEGRSDILVQDENMAAIIEVKRAKEEKELPSLVEKGMQQIVDNQYDIRFRINPSINTILHWSIAFCKKSCMAKALVASTL